MNRIDHLLERYYSDTTIIAQRKPLSDDQTGILSFVRADGTWAHLVRSDDPHQPDIAYEVVCTCEAGRVIETSCTCPDFKIRHHACKHCARVGVRMLLIFDDMWYIKRLAREDNSMECLARSIILAARMTLWQRGPSQTKEVA